MTGILGRWRERNRRRWERQILAVILLRQALNMESPSGWPLMRATRLSSGAVYTALARLEGAGLVAGEWEERVDGKPRRRLYRVTDEGRILARARVRHWLDGKETP